MGLLFRKALRDLAKMGFRSVLVFGVLAAGVAIYAGGFLAQRTLFNTRDFYYGDLRIADLDLSFGPKDPDELPPWMAALHGGDSRGLALVGASAGELRFLVPGTIELGGDRPLMSLEVFMTESGRTNERLGTVNTIALTAGRLFRPDAPGEVVVESSAANVLGLKIGDKLTLDPYHAPEEVEIVGLARSAEFLLPTANPEVLLPSKGSLAVVYRPMAKLDELFSGPMYNHASLFFAGAGASAEQKTRVVGASTPVVFNTLIDRESHYSHRFLDEDLKAFSVFIPVLSSIFGLVTFLVLLLSLSRLIATEQRELGALLAIGRTPRELIMSYVAAGAAAGLFAASVGAALAPFVSDYLASAYARVVGLPPLVPVLVWQPLALAMSLGVLAAVLAVLVPAATIVRMTPAAAIRAPADRSFRGLPAQLDRVVAGLLEGTATRFGVRNTLRRPRLTLAVVALIASAMALSIAFRISETTWRRFAATAFASEVWDAMVAFKVPLAPKDAAEIVATAGVTDIRPFVAGFGMLCDEKTGERVCVDHRIVGMGAKDPMRRFLFVDGGMFDRDDAPAIILNRNFNNLHPYAVGDELWLEQGPRRLRVRVVGLTSDMTLGVGYVPIAVARELLAMDNDKTSGFLATFGEDARTVKKRLFAHEMVTYVSLKLELQEIVYEYMEILWSIIHFATVISIALAVLFMLTGLSMALLEREVEYATLRSFGFSGFDIARIVLVEVVGEGLLATLCSIPLAFLLGHYLHYEMARAWFDVPYFWQLSDFWRVIAPALACLPFAAAPALFKVLRASPAVLLRSRVFG